MALLICLILLIGALGLVINHVIQERLSQQRVMQPLMVGVGTTTERLGDLLRRAQTGNMSTYLFAMVAGLLIFLFLTLNGL